jgi:hypothetical protein
MRHTRFMEVLLMLRLAMLSGSPLRLRLLRYRVKNTIITSPTE